MVLDRDNIGGFESEYDGMVYNYHYPKPDDIDQNRKIYPAVYPFFETVMLGPGLPQHPNRIPFYNERGPLCRSHSPTGISKNVDAYRLSTISIRIGIVLTTD
ncbi:MAG: hypothetical protein Ct9H300mP9_3470 [Candidatus Neomarinimicrobiota bacterium]|nr:MAG: hypothetical protein Ct9H300mP9_3470 [Candidatus Neomarinimicrobiota bacterium]